MADEVIELAVKATGEAEVKKLQKSMTELEREIRDLTSHFNAGRMGAAQYREEHKRLAGEIATSRRALAALATTTEGAGNRMKGFGQGVTSAGRIVQDFSAAGLNGIINNLEAVGMSFAKVAGLSGAWGAAIGGGAQLGGVAFQYLANNYQGYLDKLGLGATRTEAEQMKALEDATRLTADETKRLAEMKERAGNVAAAKGVKGADAAEQAGGLDAALAKAGGGDKVIGQVAETLRGTGLGHDEAALAEIEGHEKILAEKRKGGFQFEIDMAEAMIAKLKAKYQEDREARLNGIAEKMVGDARTDPAALKALQGRVRENAGAFAPGLADDLKGADPKRAARDRDSKDLTEQGAEIEREWRDEMDKERKQEIEATAKPMQDRVGERIMTARSNGFSEDDVRAGETSLLTKELTDAGMSPEEAASKVKEILDAILKVTNAAERDRAMGKGISVADARKQLVDEAGDKRAAKDSQEAREAAEKFKKEVPRAAELTERMALQGKGHGEIRDAIEAEMARRGIGEDAQARKDAAEGLAKEGEVGATAKVEREAESIAAKRRSMHSEVFEGTGFNRSLLTATTSGPKDDAAKLAESNKELISAIAEWREAVKKGVPAVLQRRGGGPRG